MLFTLVSQLTFSKLRVSPHFTKLSYIFARRYVRKRQNWYESFDKDEGEKNKPEEIDLLYGLNVVLPAIEQSRRTMYALYYKDSTLSRKRDDPATDRIFFLAEKHSIPTIRKSPYELSKLTEDRPHQGFVLEASRIKPIRITTLDKLGRTGYRILSPGNNSIGMRLSTRRFPLWIALDQIVDPQNLGAIMRTAYFMGVDGFVMCTTESAPLSGFASKASAGVLEVMDIYDTDRMDRFLETSSRNGWKVFGSVSPENVDATSIVDLSPPVQLQPSILVLGGEGKGLRPFIRNVCQEMVYIPSLGERGLLHVDSLNVSAAAAVLIYKFLLG
ncbi:2378_t:CDS:2 [Paraglomus brasilianum]|uniref:rRNA methyltransferase 1, mitochondrial n=1 Tax=Paraglomus brasilianum TaxID=144538 RepID=A0A9N9FUS8_9GLOM|nr:2378_t:CDS:2 [Paraglomus brasilianum]